MRADDLKKILNDIGLGNRLRTVSNNRDTNFMFCCPWHHERNPSAGISANKEYGSCYGCGQGFTLVGLVMYMMDYSFREATIYLEEKFNVQKKVITGGKRLKRYDDNELSEDDGEFEKDRESGVTILPNYKLAPYKSGKVCHSYLLDRGFSKETCRRFKIGWDESRCRITIPVFNREEGLLGFIARAVLDPKIDGEDNPEYKKVYGNTDKYLVDNFQRSHALYPIHLFPEGEETAILIEGTLDAQWMRQLGFYNVLAILNSKISTEQVNLLLSLGIKKIILFLDNDHAGDTGRAKAYKMLKSDFIVYDVTYPEGKNDPADLNKEQIQEMLDEKHFYGRISLKRLD